MTRLGTNVGTAKPNQLYEGLFRPVQENARRPIATPTPPMKGDLVLFGYQFWVHDPYPLVIVTDYQPGFRIRGLNLHYLTHANMKWLLRTYGENRAFSYQTIRMSMFLRHAFRWYKWEGIRQLRKMDIDYLLGMMGSMRRFDPDKAKLVQDAVREQIGQQLNMTAEEMTGRGIHTSAPPLTGRPVSVVPTVQAAPTAGSLPAQPGT